MSPSDNIANLEESITSRGFTISKKYDESKGICTVTVFNKNTDTTITSKNSSRMPLWSAYKKVLEFILAQLQEFERIAGRGI